MNGAPERLPPLREVNHKIPLIDESKRYKYHSPRCPDSLKPELMEKIARYTCALVGGNRSKWTRQLQCCVYTNEI
jgi:hypothetical protein